MLCPLIVDFDLTAPKPRFCVILRDRAETLKDPFPEILLVDDPIAPEGWIPFVRVRMFTFRVTRADSSVPVRLTREALEDRFEAGEGDKSLAVHTSKHCETINAKVLELAPSGAVYSTETL